ncbi:MAG: flagellar basal body P-ring protein FlgI [Alphaproteobacteria bacterium]|nr:flagellar basal body P-ring protein FlgI [Alphaproteobacteria bacterium]
MRIVMRFVKIIAFLCLCMVVNVTSASAYSRIKDIASFEGVRDNMLVGYGLVVGLNGTGDNVESVAFTKQSLVGMLERLGINAKDGSLKSKNIAAVIVTSSLPPFSKQGTTIDVTVSALGDAKSLLGGTLLVTPLVGADGEVYAVAQGQLAVGGFSSGGEKETVVKGVPTSGRIANGAIIERELHFDMSSMTSMNISLRNPDFTTCRRVAEAVNAYLGIDAAVATDPGTVKLNVPEKYAHKVVDLVTDIEQLRVVPDQLAKVVIDEQTGIIVIGENVKINKVAIAHGNLTIRVSETPLISQPVSFTDTVVSSRTSVDIDEGQGGLTEVETGITLQELVDSLNSLGIGPRDMISILQAIKASGALQAEIEVM